MSEPTINFGSFDDEKRLLKDLNWFKNRILCLSHHDDYFEITFSGRKIIIIRCNTIDYGFNTTIIYIQVYPKDGLEPLIEKKDDRNIFFSSVLPISDCQEIISTNELSGMIKRQSWEHKSVMCGMYCITTYLQSIDNHTFGNIGAVIIKTCNWLDSRFCICEANTYSDLWTEYWGLDEIIKSVSSESESRNDKKREQFNALQKKCKLKIDEFESKRLFSNLKRLV